jgi:rod shape-determining protein MreD
VQTVKIAITLIVALLLQIMLSKHLGFFRYIELPMLVTVYFALMRDPLLGMTTGLVSGLGSDIGAGPLGVGGFSKTLIGYVIAAVSIKFPLENPLARLGIVALATAANVVLVVGLYLMLGQSPQNVSAWGEFGKMIGWRTVGNTLTSVPLFIILDRVFSEQTQATRMAVKRRFYE